MGWTRFIPFAVWVVTLHWQGTPMAEGYHFGPQYSLDSTGILPGSGRVTIEDDLQLSSDKANETNQTNITNSSNLTAAAREAVNEEKEKNVTRTNNFNLALVREFLNSTRDEDSQLNVMSKEDVQAEVLRRQQSLLDHEAETRYKIEQEQVRQGGGKPQRRMTKGLRVNAITEKYAAQVNAKLDEVYDQHEALFQHKLQGLPFIVH